MCVCSCLFVCAYVSIPVCICICIHILIFVYLHVRESGPAIHITHETCMFSCVCALLTCVYIYTYILSTYILSLSLSLSLSPRDTPYMHMCDRVCTYLHKYTCLHKYIHQNVYIMLLGTTNTSCICIYVNTLTYKCI